MVRTPDAPLDVINSLGSSTLPLLSFYTQSVVIDTQARLLSEFLFADPILFFLGNYHRYLKVTRYYVRVIDKDAASLSIRTRNIYNVAVRDIRTYLQKKHGTFVPTTSSWHRRRSRSVSGTTQYRDSLNHTLSGLIGGLVDPVTLLATQVDLTRFNDSGTLREHFSFDNLVKLAKDIDASAFRMFHRTSTLSRYGKVTFSSFSITDDEVAYTLSDVIYQSFPISRKMTSPSIRVVIRRGGSTKSIGVTVTIDGVKSIIVDGTPSLGYPKWNISAYSLVSVTIGSRYDTDVLIGGVDYAEQQSYHRDSFTGTFGGVLAGCPDNINNFLPALYHTQSKALSDLMLQVGQNLQNVLQSPSFIELIDDLFVHPGDLFMDLFNPDNFRSFAHQAWHFAQFISGLLLLKDFAIDPTLRAVDKLINELSTPYEARGSFTIKGTDLSSEFSGFVDSFSDYLAIMGLSTTQVSHYEFTFTSTAYTGLDYVMATKLLLSNAFLALRTIPTPLDIYKYARGSFLVDWFINVGPLIEDHQSYVQAMTLPLRIGHTVWIEWYMKDGRKFVTFLRSEEMSLPIDPPGETWLPLSSFHVQSIPLAIQNLRF